MQRELESGWDLDLEINGRRIGHVERSNVRDDGETVWAVHSVDADNVAAAHVRADEDAR